MLSKQTMVNTSGSLVLTTSTTGRDTFTFLNALGAEKSQPPQTAVTSNTDCVEGETFLIPYEDKIKKE